ncbi:hypothetical protein PFDG_05233 [Plasmodium falciparum Dd2]|uniref:Uncharacterized protein n=1 Tax=Plasmodium falciparum (isolate Dd2) TaxID=57267 RepID=A0A0L7MAQ2_PLAF4|nr:hypothetical protein PFDG_05233 [Plasmodium falciparum Dd2]
MISKVTISEVMISKAMISQVTITKVMLSNVMLSNSDDIKSNDVNNSENSYNFSDADDFYSSSSCSVSISCVSSNSVGDGSPVHLVSDDDKGSVDDAFPISSDIRLYRLNIG